MNGLLKGYQEPLAMKITVKQFVKSLCFLYKEIPEVRHKPKQRRQKFQDYLYAATTQTTHEYA